MNYLTIMTRKPKERKSLDMVFIMDPMEKLLLGFDTSTCIMMESQRRGHRIYYIEPHELVFRNGTLCSYAREVIASSKAGYLILKRAWLDLKTCDVIFNRKEPPVDESYIHLTQLLELMERDVFVINSPGGVRKANEKLYILEFPDWIPPTIVTNNTIEIERFRSKLKCDLIVKPLDQKGGEGIMLLRYSKVSFPHVLGGNLRRGFPTKSFGDDKNQWFMVQKYLRRNTKQGDKRVLLLNGKVIGQYRRIPKKGEFRANLSLGAKFVKTKLSHTENELIKDLAPKLIRDGLYFVGIDIVDEQLIEVNVTSPAGIPEVTLLEGKHPEVHVVDFLEKQSSLRRGRP